MAFPLLVCYNAGNELEEEVSAVAIEKMCIRDRGVIKADGSSKEV